MATTAAMLAAILLGTVTGGGGDATMGGVSASRGAACSSRSISRARTKTKPIASDRLPRRRGLRSQRDAGILRDHGPKHAARAERDAGALRTHPVTSARIAESKGRASAVSAGRGGREPELFADEGAGPRAHHAGRRLTRATITPPRSPTRPTPPWRRSIGAPWGGSMAGDAGARSVLDRLRAEPYRHPAVPYPRSVRHSSRPATCGAHSPRWREARELAPRNVPVTMRYAEALMRFEPSQARARGTARPVQQRPPHAGPDPADGDNRQRRGGRRGRLLLHGGVPPDVRGICRSRSTSSSSRSRCRTSPRCSGAGSRRGWASCARRCRRNARGSRAPDQEPDSGRRQNHANSAW